MADLESKDGLAIGGGVLVGVGVGFTLLELSPLFFLGSILIGLGLGLILEYILGRVKK